MEMWQSGLVTFWVTNVVADAPQCSKKTKAHKDMALQNPIRLQDLIGVFFVLGLGLSISTLVFFLESLHSMRFC